MTDATTEFFDELGRRGHEPLLQTTTGTLRFDVADGDRVERWFVTIEKGDVTVSRKNAHADAVVSTDRAGADGMFSGKVNAMAAFLRGAIEPRGDLGLILAFQRLFPGPPTSRTKARREAQ
jgi:putative sterol carrier protein